jgi:hypothetical protein
MSISYEVLQQKGYQKKAEMRCAMGTRDLIGTSLSTPVNQFMFAFLSLHIFTMKFHSQLLQSQTPIHLILHPQGRVSADCVFVSSVRWFVYIGVMAQTFGTTCYHEHVLGQQHTPLVAQQCFMLLYVTVNYTKQLRLFLKHANYWQMYCNQQP